MTHRFGLNEKTIQQICGVFANYPQVNKAILYGSRAKGYYKTGSDIDLTLCGEVELTLGILYKIMDELDELLLPYTIDLSVFTQINDPEVIDHIRRVGITFYEAQAGKPPAMQVK
jgi:predicted nucleotidyltransferase